MKREYRKPQILVETIDGDCLLDNFNQLPDIQISLYSIQRDIFHPFLVYVFFHSFHEII